MGNHGGLGVLGSDCVDFTHWRAVDISSFHWKSFKVLVSK